MASRIFDKAASKEESFKDDSATRAMTPENSVKAASWSAEEPPSKPKRVIKTAEAVDRAGRKVGVMKTFDDGSKVQENLNGTVIEIALDGTRTQTNRDGTVITSYLDGSKRQQNRDGKVIETTVDGEQVQTNPDGTRIVLNSKDSGCGCLGL